MRKPKAMTVEDVRAFLDQPGVRALEALPTRYWRKGHLPGALPLDPRAPEASARAYGIEPDARIVVYCTGPTCSNSRQSAEALVAAGFEHVHVFEGGKEAWLEAGLKLEVDDDR